MDTRHKVDSASMRDGCAGMLDVLRDVESHDDMGNTRGLCYRNAFVKL
jgi:hypothetical protein